MCKINKHPSKTIAFNKYIQVKIRLTKRELCPYIAGSCNLRLVAEFSLGRMPVYILCDNALTLYHPQIVEVLIEVGINILIIPCTARTLFSSLHS